MLDTACPAFQADLRTMAFAVSLVTVAGCGVIVLLLYSTRDLLRAVRRRLYEG